MRAAVAPLRGSNQALLLAVLLAVLAVPLTWLALQRWLIVVALVYPVAFWIVAWRWPHVALALIFAAVPFQNDVSGGALAKFSVAEIHLALTAPVFLVQNLVRKRPVLPGPLSIPLALYFAVCLYSSWVTWRPDSALISLAQMFLYLVVAVSMFASFARREEDLLLSLRLYVCVGVFLAAVVIVTRSNYVLGLHKNGVGASLGCAVVICTELWFAARGKRAKTLLAGALAVIAAGLLLSLSRGAWLGSVAGLVVVVWMRRQYRLLLRGMLLLVPVITLAWSLLPKESQQYATNFSQRSYNINARLEMIDFARSQFEKSPAYGVGVGLRKEYDATNIVWLLLAETGVLGLAAFLYLHGVALRTARWTASFVEHSDPLYSLVVIGVALVVDKFCHGLVDHYWSRGAITVVWGSMGMALAVYYRCRNGLSRREIR